MRRALFVAVAGVLMLALGSVAAVFSLVATESGTAWLVARVESRTEFIVSIGAVEGTLWRGLGFSDVELAIEAGTVRLSRIELTGRLRELLRGVVAVDDLRITDVAYRQADPSGSVSAESATTFPFSVLVRQGVVERIVVESAEEPLEVGPIRFALTASADGVVADSVSVSAFGFIARGSAELQFDADPFVAAAFDWSTEVDGLSLAGAGRVDGTLSVLQIHQELSVPFTAVADGELRLGEEPHADLQLQWTALTWPGDDRFVSPSGEMRVAGWMDSFEFDGNGTIEWQEDVFAVSARGLGSPAMLTFEALDVTGAYGHVTATGQANNAPLSWDLQIDARDIDPSTRFEDWPGALGLRGRFSGSVEPTLQWALAEASVEGVLADQPMTATGGIAFNAPGSWSLGAVNIVADGNRAFVDGTIDAAFDLELVIDAPNVARLWPEASGSLSVDGRLAGSFEAPDFAGSVQARSLTYGDYSFGYLAVEGGLSLRDNAPFSLALDAQDVTWRNNAARAITGRISGTSAAHDIELDVESAYGTGLLRATGIWSPAQWEGRFTALTLDQESLGSWQLGEPTRARLSSGRIEIEPTCVRQGEASLCVSARIGTDDDGLEATLSNFDLATANAFLDEDLSLAGTYDATLRLAGPLRQPTGRLSLDGASTVITIREGAGPPLEIPIAQLELEAALLDSTLDLAATLSGQGSATVSLDAEVTDIWTDDPGVRAELTGLWTELTALSLLSPDIGDIAGTATLDILVFGTVGSPEVQGRARWIEGQLAVPRWGFTIDGIELSASSPGGERLLVEGYGMAGDGRVEVAGVVELDAEAGWPMRFTIDGESLQAVQLPDAEIYISPALEVDAVLPTVRVSGSIDIPRAQLRLEEVPAQAVVPSADTVVHGIDVVEPRRPLDVSADLRVELGDDVRYSGAGLDVGLTGEIGLNYQSGRNALSSGVVNLEGTYSAYGQTLALEQSRLLFTGPLGDPGLDVRAVRQVETTTVGVRLSGTVNSPTTTVFSEPAMNEADALAYLILGRPLSGSGDAETATLESAAVSMGLRQALPAIQRVGETLGFDEFSVRTTAADTGELMAGKQISPRLYMRYTYGIFNRIGGLLFRLRLTDRVSLETRSGEYKAMDLIYTVERE
ncbi:MAG: translocation/assembly module TamB domain-containing protein [Gammaproteobacteria bacterium]|nr:translocation/assembly module TamB domain-containing protein [Gammaproteobacteria bacterium]